MLSPEYRDVISAVVSLVRDDVSTAPVNVSRGAVPLLLAVCLVVLHVECESVEYKQASARPPGDKLCGNCEEKPVFSYLFVGLIENTETSAYFYSIGHSASFFIT